MKIHLIYFNAKFTRITKYGNDKCEINHFIKLELFDYIDFKNWDQIRFINKKIRDYILLNFSLNGIIKEIFPVIKNAKCELITFINNENHSEEKYL